MFIAKTVAFVVLALSAGSFVGEAYGEELATINLKQQGLQKNVRFLDKNGDGLNDLLQDSDGDGIPDGRMRNGSGYGLGGFSRQGGGRVMINGAGKGGFGRGYGNGFRQGRGRR
jgi:hypothetical protein